MQHYGVNGYSLHAMNSLSAMYNLHQQAAQQAQHAPDYRPSVHALTLAERLAGKGHGGGAPGQGAQGPGSSAEKRRCPSTFPPEGTGPPREIPARVPPAQGGPQGLEQSLSTAWEGPQLSAHHIPRMALASHSGQGQRSSARWELGGVCGE